MKVLSGGLRPTGEGDQGVGVNLLGRTSSPSAGGSGVFHPWTLAGVLACVAGWSSSDLYLGGVVPLLLVCL